MNARSLCLALIVLACGSISIADAQTAKPNDPATSTTAAKPAPPATAGTMQISKKVTGEFAYRFLPTKGEASAPTPLPTSADNLIALPIPVLYKGGTLEIRDNTHGDMARLPIATDKSTELAESSFGFVQSVKVPVTAGGKPAGGVLVALSSKDGKFKQETTLKDADGGIARFDDVPLDTPITATVKFGGNAPSSQTNTISRGHAPDGYSFSPINVDWKDVKTVAAIASPASNTAAPTAAPANGVPPTLPQSATPAQPASGGGLGSVVNNLIGLAALAGIAYGVFWAYQNGKIKTLFDKLGIQTAALVPDAGAVASNPFQKQTAPVQPITDGTADPFAGGGGIGTVVAPAAPVSTGPRLVATMGTYSGQIFPLNAGSADIGRDANNPIALPNDTNASRRHATIQAGSGQATVTDHGSSNGTFINGVRISAQTPTPLKPNDELTVGNTRFRFEA